MKKFYSTVSEPTSSEDHEHMPLQPRRSTIDFIRSFARACQSVRNDNMAPELAVVVLN